MTKKSNAFRVTSDTVWPHFRIYQIEMTSFCNLKCSYCPHPEMLRSKGHISEEVLGAALDWIIRAGGKRVALHHFGEPLLHPNLKARLEQVARSGIEMQISSNGVLLDRLWDELLEVDYPMTIMLSIHQWSSSESDYLKALRRYQALAEGTKIAIMPAYNIIDGRFSFHAWAEGQRVDWNASQCPFVRYNAAVILWNGDIAGCCVDHEGVTSRYNLLDEEAYLHQTRVWSGCATCDVGRIMANETWE